MMPKLYNKVWSFYKQVSVCQVVITAMKKKQVKGKTDAISYRAIWKSLSSKVTFKQRPKGKEEET